MVSLKLMVCPHDTSTNPERWYFFSQYLSGKLGHSVQFQTILDFKDFHSQMDQAAIIYANPQDTVKLVNQKGFIPLCRPAELYDEVVFIASPEIENPTLQNLHGQEIASVTSMLATNIGVYALKKQDIHPDKIIGKNSWFEVANCILRGQMDYAFVYKDTYDEFSDTSKGMMNVIQVSEEKSAFHVVNLHPEQADLRPALETTLLEMHTDDKGAEVLSKLEISQWLPVNNDDVQMLEKLAHDIVIPE